MARCPPRCRPAEGHAHRVLVVDDSPPMRGFVADVLEGEGYATLAQADGAAALERARAKPPCLGLVDVPFRDGEWRIARRRGGRPRAR